MNNSIHLPSGSDKPRFLQLAAMVTNPQAFLQDCQRQHGFWFEIKTGMDYPAYCTSDIDAIKQIFTTGPEILNAGEANSIALQPIVGKNSLLTLDGAAHMRQRKLLLPPFHGERMQKYADTIRELAKKNIATWPREGYFPVIEKMHAVTLEVILTTIFGVNDAARYSKLRDLVRKLANKSKIRLLMNISSQFPVLKYISKLFSRDFFKLLNQIDQMLYEEIKLKRAQPPGLHQDILSMLVEARDENNQPMTDIEIRDELVTLLIAGHDTSATALTWTLYHVLSNPAIYQKLKTVLQDKSLGFRHPYLEAVINESLRINPVIYNVARVTQQPITIGKYHFPEKVILVPMIYLVHHREDLWPDAETYKPERFLKSYKPYTFFPFGGGVRRCIGMQFAMYEMKIILYEIFTQLDLELQPNYIAGTTRRGIIHVPKGGVPICVKQRASFSSVGRALDQ